VTQAPSSPTAVVVIVAYNAAEHLQRCVDALERQSFADFAAIVWDNGSSDDAVRSLRARARIRVEGGGENLGVAAANNRAAALSRAPYIVTLNPDAFPEPDWLERLIGAARTYDADCVASLQLSDRDPDILDGAGDCMSIAGIGWRGGYGQPRATAPAEPVEVFAACAAAALYRREAFEALGGFEERFFCYYEDVDLGFRLRLAGGCCVLEPRAIVRHVGSASSDQVSGFAEYHGARNRLWTFLRDMPTVLMPIALPAHVLVIAYVMLRSSTKAMRDARWRGLKDGWAGRKPFLRERRWFGAPIGLLRTLAWTPMAISRRGVHARPIRAARKVATLANSPSAR
jgi:GT2 family glycosyltransferase